LALLAHLMRAGEVTTKRATPIGGTDSRKARKDLEALAGRGVPLRIEGEGDERRWVLDDNWRLHGHAVELTERLALLVGRELVTSFLHDTELGEGLALLDREIEHAQPLGEGRAADLVRRFLYVHEPAKDYGPHRRVLAQVVGAVLSHHTLTFAYVSARGGRPRRYARIAPLTLVIYKRGVYVLFEHKRRYETCAIERMSDVVVHSDKRFAYPPPSVFDPRRVLAGRFGLTPGKEPPATVRIRCDATVRPYIEGRTWMPGQRVEPRDDGRCDLVFVASGQELVSFVLQWGDKVEVIEPAWLRAAVADELTRAAARYADGGT